MKDKQKTATDLFDVVDKGFNQLEIDAVDMHKNSAYIKAVRKCRRILCEQYNMIMGAQV